MGYGFQWMGLGEGINQGVEQVNTMRRQKLGEQELAQRKAEQEQDFGLRQQAFKSAEEDRARKDFETTIGTLPAGRILTPDQVARARQYGVYLDLGPDNELRSPYMTAAQKEQFALQRRGQDIEAESLKRYMGAGERADKQLTGTLANDVIQAMIRARAGSDAPYLKLMQNALPTQRNKFRTEMNTRWNNLLPGWIDFLVKQTGWSPEEARRIIQAFGQIEGGEGGEELYTQPEGR